MSTDRLAKCRLFWNKLYFRPKAVCGVSHLWLSFCKPWGVTTSSTLTHTHTTQQHSLYSGRLVNLNGLPLPLTSSDQPFIDMRCVYSGPWPLTPSRVGCCRKAQHGHTLIGLSVFCSTDGHTINKLSVDKQLLAKVLVSNFYLQWRPTPAKPSPNQDDAGPIVPRPMGLPIAAVCDTARDRTRVCSEASKPPRHSGGVKGKG